MKKAARINRQRELLDKQIEEETRREIYFLAEKKTNNKTSGSGVESPDDNEQDTAAPTNLSSAFKPLLAYPTKPTALPGKTKFLDIPVTAPSTSIPKYPLCHGD